MRRIEGTAVRRARAVVVEPLTVRAGLSADTEATIIALVRARFCELAGRDRLDANGAEMFTLGLFSLIDALFEIPMSELLDKLPFATDVCEALVEHKGPKGQLIECLKALESGDLEKAEAILPAASDLYVSALRWASGGTAMNSPQKAGSIARLSLRTLPSMTHRLAAGGMRP